MDKRNRINIYLVQVFAYKIQDIMTCKSLDGMMSHRGKTTMQQVDDVCVTFDKKRFSDSESVVNRLGNISQHRK